jgi:hypothetical protein
MHNLESILLLSSVALEKRKISTRELAKVLLRLASASHSYEPTCLNTGHTPTLTELSELGQEWHRRFDDLLYDK